MLNFPPGFPDYAKTVEYQQLLQFLMLHPPQAPDEEVLPPREEPPRARKVENIRLASPPQAGHSVFSSGLRQRRSPL